MVDEIIKKLVFDGTDRLDFPTYKRQLLALGGIRSGFDEALTRSLSVSNTLAWDYEDNKKKRKMAWSHLYLTLIGAPAALIEKQTSTDPSIAWTALCNQYEPSTVEAFTQITRDMENCTMEEEE